MQMQPIAEFTESRSRPIEWPTWIAIAGLWLVFAALIYFHAELPWWVLTPVGAWLVAFHGSLQHEAIHGHPTRSHLLNEFLLFPAISLWIPYRRYRRLHLTHHRNDQLTDPEVDPESYYLDPQAWERTPNALRWLYTVNNTMLGRFILGPGDNHDPPRRERDCRAPPWRARHPLRLAAPCRRHRHRLVLGELGVRHALLAVRRRHRLLGKLPDHDALLCRAPGS